MYRPGGGAAKLQPALVVPGAAVGQALVDDDRQGGDGAGAVRLAKSGTAMTATEVWRLTGSAMGNHWSTPVAYNGHYYGLFGDSGSVRLKCIEAATGAETWPGGVAGFGPGGILVVDGKLIPEDPTQPTRIDLKPEREPEK